MAKKIKKEKIASITSMHTLLDEISNGTHYKYVRTDLGVPLNCLVNFEVNPKLLVLEMKLLEGITLSKFENSLDHYE